MQMTCPQPSAEQGLKDTIDTKGTDTSAGCLAGVSAKKAVLRITGSVTFLLSADKVSHKKDVKTFSSSLSMDYHLVYTGFTRPEFLVLGQPAHLLGLLLLLSRFSRVQLCATPQAAAHQAPPSLGFSRQEYWSGLPFPSPTHAFTWTA